MREEPIPVDERLVAPETRYEIIDGELCYVAPADYAHGSLHSRLSALLEAHAADDYEVASDLLTRTSEVNDFAPDASVFRRERNPETGGRYLEELAFEIAATERLSHAARKAAELARRGVRRVFAIDSERLRAFEWSRDLGTWSLLSATASIEDRALAVPLPVAALVQAAKADDAMASALLAKGNRVLAEAISEAEATGMTQALIRVLNARGLQPDAAQRERIGAARDLAVIERWLDRASVASCVEDVIDRD